MNMEETDLEREVESMRVTHQQEKIEIYQALDAIREFIEDNMSTIKIAKEPKYKQLFFIAFGVSCFISGAVVAFISLAW
jgi:hypothetical protein